MIFLTTEHLPKLPDEAKVLVCLGVWSLYKTEVKQIPPARMDCGYFIVRLVKENMYEGWLLSERGDILETFQCERSGLGSLGAIPCFMQNTTGLDLGIQFTVPAERDLDGKIDWARCKRLS